jgi:signal transduction histidine kinase
VFLIKEGRVEMRGKTKSLAAEWIASKRLSIRLLIMIAILIFVVEAIVMSFIIHGPKSFSPFVDVLVDPLLLVSLLSPIFYYFLFRPLRMHITERKRAEEALQVERNLLETVTQNIGGRLAIISKEYKTLWSNKIQRRMFGDAANMPCYKAYNQRAEVCPACGVQEVFKTGKDKVVHEQYGIGVDGKPVWSEIIVTPIKDKEGNVTAALELVLPITERKKAEQALQESEKQLRFLSSQLLTAQEAEKRRISRELHDELGQALALLKLQMRHIEKGLQEDQAELREETERVREYIDQVIENVRRISRDLSPCLLEDLGLSAALKWLIKNVAENYKVQSSLDAVDIDHTFSREAQVLIYRIFQEALTNIVRYAEATEISFAITQQNGDFSFFVEDNGNGFDVDEVRGKNPAERGMGLATMAQRAQMLGGSLELRSREGKGVRIILTVAGDRNRKEDTHVLVSHCTGR